MVESHLEILSRLLFCDHSQAYKVTLSKVVKVGSCSIQPPRLLPLSHSSLSALRKYSMQPYLTHTYLLTNDKTSTNYLQSNIKKKGILIHARVFHPYIQQHRYILLVCFPP